MAEPSIERIGVPFAGPGEGTAPLTWGQKAIMQDMRATGWTHNNSGAHPLPEGLTVADMAERLSRLMGKHPALRTQVGVDADGRPCQVVHGRGEIDLEVATFPDEVDRAEAIHYGNLLWFEWMQTPLELDTPWLLRMSVMQHRGAAVYLVLTVGHLAADGTGTLLVMTDLGIGELAEREVDPDAVWTIDLARREQTPEVRRVSDRAMRYWERQLRPLPPTTFGEPTHPQGRQGHRYWHGRFNSQAAYLAVLAIAQRTRTDTSRVLLAVIAIAIGRATGRNPLTSHVIVSNRFRPGLADVIGTLSQNSVLTVDLDGTVDDVIGRVRQAATVAWMHAYYDPDQLEELTGRLDAERGHPARITCRISDRRFSTRPATEARVRDAVITPAAIAAKQPETFISWDGHLDNLPEQAFINIEDQPETVHLQLVFDMGVLSTEEVETMLRAVEEVAIEAAFDPAAPTRVPAAARHPT
ncbi:condensation domain-containing protein [Labedaea rhizosphaerae]|uniref:Condensation domain-containing protein n=1 Tax=Labedaea rhizosphaerae TaxID=598644 RepID=A0A4R6S0G8_LABRH|nr:condensation domain-containing protein [Labedaea rhizosphaerae]TDP92982.1 condensation domain-containing protein [Labedaea rhizosphaerae]